MIMATILHKIKAWLYDNLLTKDNPNDYIARVSAERTLNIREICESAVARGGADISIAAMEHAVNLFLKEMGYLLCDGYSINTGWFTAGVQIRGVFDSPDEKFDPKKHTLLFEFHQGALLRRECDTITVEILGVANTGAMITRVTDVKTGSVNDLLTPNRNLKISGDKIKIVGDNAVNGIYFVNQSTGKRFKVDETDIVINYPSELIIVIPALEADTYQLEVTTQYALGTLLKEPRTAFFEKTLTVQ
jgi:hypothetical protein